MKFKSILGVLFISIPIFFLSCNGFNRLEHIVGPYYLVEVDTKEDLSISYQTKDGDYVGKVPPTVIDLRVQ